MNKSKRLIAFNVVMAILIILLYSPYQLALNPLSPDFINAALSVIFAAVIGYELVHVNGKALLEARSKKRLELGPGEATVDDIKRALGEYKKTAVIGIYARNAIAQLETAERKREALYNIIGQKFQEGSLSWQKFVEGVEAVTQAIAQNSALLLKRLETFDVEDFNRNAKNTITGMFNRGTVPENVRQERRSLYEANLDEMRGIVAANERLLTELDKFSMEMSLLESSANATANTRLLEEINELVDETKFYH